jgi:hypothetical protein
MQEEEKEAEPKEEVEQECTKVLTSNRLSHQYRCLKWKSVSLVLICPIKQETEDEEARN